MLDKYTDTVADINITERRGLVVWMYNLRQLKSLKKFGSVMYASRKMKYAIIYVNQEGIDETIEALNKLHFVRSVDQSHRPEVAVEGNLESILKDVEPSEEDFIYKGKKVTPLIMTK
ncbi:YlbG family protein [Vagococcus coleopterorum]|uniref:YlbG family protein n=1 Tax=Vagococcus coleopterorum TaxID=2714946 RepID=A0A6G8AMP5_9ENTE|nr:YlbG family protein [Vagococcus coleopterorum]QIL46338.1 YlbG family protein [Vagococcus coleopterorum]